MTGSALTLGQTPGDLAGTLLFYLFALICAGAALGVVLCRNIVRMAVCLLFALIGVAGLYFLLDSEFLAAVQLVVYVGGTLILIVFGVMLTSRSPFSRFDPTRTEVVIATCIALVLLSALIAAILKTPFAISITSAEDGYPVGALGQALLGDFLVPFELASIILLLVMIGAAYLAKRRRPEENQTAAGGEP